MIVVLTLEESEDQIISGFPESITLSTGVLPSTIFYTLDGSDPDEDSEIFVNKITLPTTGLTTTLKAVAKVVDLSGTYYSGIVEKTYFTKQTKVDKTRLIGKEGINILPPGKTPIDNLSFNSDGDIAQATTIPIQKLDLIGSTANYKGEDISGSTTLDFINFAEKPESIKKPIVSSPNNNNINFDPKSFYIVIDGFTPEALDNQIVRIINRPHGTMDLVSPFYARGIQNQQVTTSNFVRYMINPNSDKIVLYYRESREGRWIKSIQKTEIKTLNLSKTASPPSSFVFRWIENRAQSKLY
jgi:hypothetical protein